MPKAVWHGVAIAESDDVEVVDGCTYFPADSVNREHLRASDHRSVGAWKGFASDYDVVVDGEANRATAWEHREPSDRAAPLVAGRIGFGRGVRVVADGDADRPGRLLSRRAGRRR